MRQRRKTRWATLTLAGAGVLLLAAACGSDNNAGNEDDGDRAAPERTSTSDETTTTTLAAEGPEEWVEVVRDLNQRYFDLLHQPDPAQLSTLFWETCECWDTHYQTLEFLQGQGEHVEGAPAVVRFVKHEQTTPETGVVALTVKEQQLEPMKRVKADGEVVQTLTPERPTACVALSIARDQPTDPYRILTQLSLDGCPDGS